MDLQEPVQQVQVAATVQDIINDHINGLSGYQIAEKYGLDTEKVKHIINEADRRLAFVPADENGNKTAPVDAVIEPIIQPLPEGENPEVGKVKGHK